MADEIVIERGVPLPPEGNYKSAFRLDEMEVGDSFFWGGEERKVRSAKHYYEKHAGAAAGKKFSVRKEGSGVRVWRVS